MRRLAIAAAAVLLILGPEAAIACPVCFSQAAQSPMVDAALLGVAALMTITMGVLGGFAAFIRHLARRANATRDTDL